jgi:hypothetical protein
MWNKGVGLSALLLELENFTEGSNSIVLGVIVLSLLALLFLDRAIHWELDGLLDALEALNLLSHEMGATMLSDHTNSIDRSLSNGRVLRLGVTTDLSDNLWINWPEEIRSKELNHVVKDEKKELLLLLGIVLCNFWKYCGNELLDKVTAMSLVSLEKNTEDFSESNLELILILVLFLENSKIFLVEFVFFIAFKVLFLVLGVILNSVFRLLDETKDFLGKCVNACWLKKILPRFLDDFLDSLSLADKTVCLSFTLHSFDKVVAVGLRHFVNLGNVFWLSFFSAFDQTWKSSSTRVSDVVTCIELSKS